MTKMIEIKQVNYPGDCIDLQLVLYTTEAAPDWNIKLKQMLKAKEIEKLEDGKFLLSYKASHNPIVSNALGYLQHLAAAYKPGDTVLNSNFTMDVEARRCLDTLLLHFY